MPRETTGGQLGRRIRQVLTPDLLSPEWRGRLTGVHPTEGHCYVAAEALFHMLGGRRRGLTPNVISGDGWTHWFLRDKSGNILDVTKGQFGGERPPYEDGRGSGFLTRRPSKRAMEVMRRVK